MFVHRLRAQKRAGDWRRNRFAHGPVLPAERRFVSRARIGPRHHRAYDAGAVLGVVNALRFASTRPVAGPAGIDDACARHRLAITRWWSDLMTAHNDVDDDIRGRMVGSSPQCRTALLRFATTASGARIRPTLPGHGFERIPSRHRSSVVQGPLAAPRSQDHAPPRGSVHQGMIAPGLTERSIDGRVIERDRRRSEHSSRGSMPALSPHPRSPTTARRPPHRRARARHSPITRIACEWGTAMDVPERAEHAPEPISIARCRELLGDEADALADDEVLRRSRATRKRWRTS